MPWTASAERWPAWPLDGRIVNLDLADPDRLPEGRTSSASPGRTVPLQRVPVTTVPMPSTGKTRSIGRRAAPPRSAPALLRRGLDLLEELLDAGSCHR